MAPIPKFRTCDTCRKRKTRCVESSPSDPSASSDDARCTTCTRLELPCTYRLGYKKAGRPRSIAFARDTRDPSDLTSHTESRRVSDVDGVHRQRTSDGNSQNHERRQSEPYPPPASSSSTKHYSSQPWPPTAQAQRPHPSAQPVSGAGAGAGPAFSFEDLLDWPSGPAVNMPSVDSTSSVASHPAHEMGRGSIYPSIPGPSSLDDHILAANANTSGSLPMNESPGSASLLSSSNRFFTTTTNPNEAIEGVAPWPTILDFINIFLRYSSTLFPLVHLPTFCKSLATRFDKTDREFAALILGIVAYTIGQLPLNRFTPQYSRNQLLSLQQRCHLASMALVDRQYKKISTNQIATLMTAYFYCQSVGKTNQAVVILAEACQLTHLLCMQAQDDGSDVVARELKRRVFWHVYAVDITEACSGHMIHLHSFEGFPALPLDVDDELITTRGAFAPSPGTESPLSGFVGVVQIFPLFAECLIRHRRVQQRIREGRPLSTQEILDARAWIASTRLAVEEQMCNLPDTLRSHEEPSDPIRRAVVGMQRANILVTEASLRLTLLDYALEVEPASQALTHEKIMVARTALEVLSALPLDDLASNGESMRGKICRILYHLLRNGDMFDDQTLSSLHGWCNLYSAVHFVQLSKNDLESCFPSRQASPALP